MMSPGGSKFSNTAVAEDIIDEIPDETPDETETKPKVLEYHIDNKDETLGSVDPMVASLNRTLAHKDTLKSYNSSTGVNQTLNDSLAYSQTAGTLLKNTINNVPMEVIHSEDDEGTSQTSERKQIRPKKPKNNSDSDDDIRDDIDRFEEIGMFNSLTQI